MFDFIKRWIWGELDKDKIKDWALEKIKNEQEEAIFKKKCEETPSFSKCVISNPPKSQKQKHQLKSYKEAVVETNYSKSFS